MDRDKLLELWNDMWKEGNWVPSWPDSLNGLTAITAAWKPDPNCHSIWQEVVHVIFWRRVTIERFTGGEAPSSAVIEAQEFAMPADINEENWLAAVNDLKLTQDEIAALIKEENTDIERIPYHLIHDAYHLGRITQIRMEMGTSPAF